MISVIIPTLDEERALPPLLDAVLRQRGDHEVIVVDGGSRDRTAAIARERGVRIIVSPPGRGTQLCAGVEASRGDVLFFLHADSVLPAGAFNAIEATLAADSRTVGGNFRLVFDGDTAFAGWLTGFYASIRRIGLYYGDSGIFVRRSAYDALGGMRPIALMEDLDFVRRMERFGPTGCIADPPLVTSSRRFAGRRPYRIVCGWLTLHALFYLGISPDRLAAIYRTHAPPRSRRAA